MAGKIGGVFKEILSPFLRQKLEQAIQEEGEASQVARAITAQYLKTPMENQIHDSESRRHYEAEVHIHYQGKPLKGVERLYKRVIVIEPTTVCAAHCRWCLRGDYPVFNLSEEELVNCAKFCGDKQFNRGVREVLITGGDPFMIPDRLNLLIDALVAHAPNVRIVRIGSRVPVQSPERVNAKLMHTLRPRKGLRIELATHVNHPAEFFPESVAAFDKILRAGVHVYDQTVLLKGLNDDLDTLIRLYDRMRSIGIEAHYLFHCIPMQGMSHFRTSVDKGLDLIRKLNSTGKLSGRCKPMYTAMTDLGKITFYDGVILDRDGNRLLLQTGYSYAERKAWNPFWEKPDSVEVGEDELMRVWYVDGIDD